MGLTGMTVIVNTKIVIKAIMQRPEIFLIFIVTTNEWVDIRILGIMLMPFFQNTAGCIFYYGFSDGVTMPMNKQ